MSSWKMYRPAIVAAVAVEVRDDRRARALLQAAARD
jgi:hypothetical protein